MVREVPLSEFRMTAVRLCSNCKWYNGLHNCDAPQNLASGLSGWPLVEGGSAPPSRRWISCAFMRSQGWLSAILNRACGRRGRWYQPVSAGDLLKRAQQPVKSP